MISADASPSCAAWDARGDATRLLREAPSLAAFPGARGMVWLSSYNYSLRMDGLMEKRHRLLIPIETAQGRTFTIPRPFAGGPSDAVTEALWLDLASGEAKGALETSMGQDGLTAVIPPGSGGGVIAIETMSASRRKNYLDDALTLAGPLPVWEQRIEAEIPEGRDCYWQGTGVGSPERRVEQGIEHIVWTVMNQPEWRASGLVDEHPPALVFSLSRGLATSLRELKNLENAPLAPPRLPMGAQSDRSPQKAVDSIAAYMSGRIKDPGGMPPSADMERASTGEGGPWTPLEGTLIAKKWLESIGMGAKVFWCQRIPVDMGGPDSMSIWSDPVLLVSGGTSQAYFVAGRDGRFGKLPHSLRGATVYRLDDEVQRAVIPQGNASENALTQQWRLSIGTDGIASGSLDITATGGWASLLAGEGEGVPEDAMDIANQMSFDMPALTLEPVSVETVTNGYRATFGVRASLGIVSGGHILMRMPGGLPRPLYDMPNDGDGFRLRFPFAFEQSVAVSTPDGYRSFGLPGKTEHGDSKALLDESVAFTEKKSLLEASSKWTVRSTRIDLPLAARMADQLALARRWSEMTVPLRK
ncbi:MAG: hypothetical protein LBF92_04885 [Synergistaceae bacterium]|nr:hypothetical protein [Synergistaceae bacterium]